MAAWDNQAPIPAPNYNQGRVDFSQLANLFQQQPPQQQRPQQQPLPGPYQPAGQPMNIQPQLPFAQRLAQYLGNWGQPGSTGNIGGTGGPFGGQI
jgi:hypothetical protein